MDLGTGGEIVVVTSGADSRRRKGGRRGRVDDRGGRLGKGKRRTHKTDR